MFEKKAQAVTNLVLRLWIQMNLCVCVCISNNAFEREDCIVEDESGKALDFFKIRTKFSYNIA